MVTEKEVDEILKKYDIFGLFFLQNEMKYFDDFREELIELIKKEMK